MFHWLNKLFQSHDSRAARATRYSLPRVEELEQRALPSATPVSVVGDLRADVQHAARLEARLEKVQSDLSADKAAYAKDLADLKADLSMATALAGQRDKFLAAAAAATDASVKKADLQMAENLEAQLVKVQIDIKADKTQVKKDAVDLAADSAAATRLQAKLDEVQADIRADQPVVPPPAT